MPNLSIAKLGLWLGSGGIWVHCCLPPFPDVRCLASHRDPHAAGGAVQMPGAAVRVAAAAAARLAGVLPQES